MKGRNLTSFKSDDSMLIILEASLFSDLLIISFNAESWPKLGLNSILHFYFERLQLRDNRQVVLAICSFQTP